MSGLGLKLFEVVVRKDIRRGWLGHAFATIPDRQVYPLSTTSHERL